MPIQNDHPEARLERLEREAIQSEMNAGKPNQENRAPGVRVKDGTDAPRARHENCWHCGGTGACDCITCHGKNGKCAACHAI